MQLDEKSQANMTKAKSEASAKVLALVSEEELKEAGKLASENVVAGSKLVATARKGQEQYQKLVICKAVADETVNQAVKYIPGLAKLAKEVTTLNNEVQSTKPVDGGINISEVPLQVVKDLEAAERRLENALVVFQNEISKKYGFKSMQEVNDKLKINTIKKENK